MPHNVIVLLTSVYLLKLVTVKRTNDRLWRTLTSLPVKIDTAMCSWIKCISLSFKLAQHILDDCFWQCCVSTPGGQTVQVNHNKKVLHGRNKQLQANTIN